MANTSSARRAKRSRYPFITGLILLGLSAPLAAQEPAVQRKLRFDLTPLVGYRTSMSFPIQPYVQATNPRVVLDPSPSYGLAFGVRIREDDLVEFRWARQNTYTRVENVNVTSPKQGTTFDQFHGDFSHEYVIDEWAPGRGHS